MRSLALVKTRAATTAAFGWSGRSPPSRPTFRYVSQRKAGLSWRRPGFVQSDEEPVTAVSWNDAAAFCRWLSQETGSRFRLPSEAEWEYACRSGGEETIQSALEKRAWYSGNSGLHTHPVGTSQTNTAGLCDLLGNVAEWVEDVACQLRRRTG